MAILNFPPTAGEPTDGSFQYTENNITYIWNGSYWSSATGTSSDLDNRYLNRVGPETLTGDLAITGDINLGIRQGPDTTSIVAGTIYKITGLADPPAPGQFTGAGAPDGNLETVFLATSTTTLTGGNLVATAPLDGVAEVERVQFTDTSKQNNAINIPPYSIVGGYASLLATGPVSDCETQISWSTLPNPSDPLSVGSRHGITQSRLVALDYAGNYSFCQVTTGTLATGPYRWRGYGINYNMQPGEIDEATCFDTGFGWASSLARNCFGFYGRINQNNGTRLDGDDSTNWNLYVDGTADSYLRSRTQFEYGIELVNPGSANDISRITNGLVNESERNPVRIKSSPTQTYGSGNAYGVLHAINTDNVASNTTNLFANHTLFSNDCLTPTANIILNGSGTTSLSSVRMNAANCFGYRTELFNNYLQGTPAYGIYSSVDQETASGLENTVRYNFYAEGSAPSKIEDNLHFEDSNPYDINTNPLGTTPVRGSIVGAFFHSGLNTSTATNANIALNRFGSTTGRFISFIEDGVFRDAIELDGSNGVVFGGVSDYRLKENIANLPSAVDQVKALRPVNFSWKSSPGKERPGFIAHEVAEVISSAVTGTKDAEIPIGTLKDCHGVVLETGVAEPSEEELIYEEKVCVCDAIPATETIYEDVVDDGIDHSEDPTWQPPQPKILQLGQEEIPAVYEYQTRRKTWTQTGTEPRYQQIDNFKLIPILTKALQEALERIEALEAAQA